MINKRLEEDLKKAAESQGYSVTDIVLYIPQKKELGDYATNLALQLAKLKPALGKQSSLEIAKEIVEKMDKPDYLEKVEIAGPGFINFFIKDKVLLENLDKVAEISQLAKLRKILIEFATPNTHKALHIGHLRNITLGESLARLLQSRGNDIYRANYQGDIGLHVAKALWGIKKMQLDLQKIDQSNVAEKAKVLAEAYALGSKAYEEDNGAKAEIEDINAKLYKQSFQQPCCYKQSLKTSFEGEAYKLIYQKDPEILPLWQKTRQWSLDYFEDVYKILGTHFDKLFFESEVFEEGKKIVEEHIKDGIFEISEGAVIFNGEKYGLHKRVFITRSGFPTYEAKDMGLAFAEFEAFPFDQAIHVVGNEQTEYFKVAFKALELIDPKFVGKEFHLSYGTVLLPTGRMSSRRGEVVTFEDLYNEVKGKVEEVMIDAKLESKEEVVRQITVGAIKFALLKFAPPTNVVLDIKKSVSLEGDSGPYLQYTYARIQSVLEKTSLPSDFKTGVSLEPEERDLILDLEYFAQTTEQAAIEYRPNLLAQYLLDLAKGFNLFYQKHRILSSEKEDFRLQLTYRVGEVLGLGLKLLGIESPKRM